MESNFDFNKVGKKMPYTVPDEFFSELESNIMKDIKADNPKRKVRSISFAVKSILTVAAVIACLLLLRTEFVTPPKSDFSNVEQAFNNLSNEDRDYLIAVYQEDIFINE